MAGVLLPPENCKVYTPRPLADAMVAALASCADATWLEPCMGRGVFAEALLAVGVNPRRITGIDLDPHAWPVDGRIRALRGVEFLAWSLAATDRFDRVIGNPPFVALSKLPGQIQQAALRVSDPDGNKLRLGCNCWYAFLCSCLRLLRKGGGIAFVLPASFEFADYAEPLRRILPRQFRQVAVHRSSGPVFDTVQEGTVVLLANGYQESSSTTIRFEYANLPKLLHGLHTRRAPKSPQFAVPQHHRLTAPLIDTVELGDVLEIGLGCVTGDSRYFLLTEEERRARSLPASACRPVLAKARHLIAAEIDRTVWERLNQSGEKVWLFAPPDRLLEHPSVRAYLREGEAGGCRIDGYKVSRRTPWHRIQLPRRPDGFLSGMADLGPWIAFRGTRSLTATNTLYTVRFRQACSRDEKAAWALGLLTARVRAQVKLVARVYAQGLRKLEPGDVKRLMIPRPKRLRGASGAYRRAVNALFTDGPAGAQALAEEFFEGDFCNGD